MEIMLMEEKDLDEVLVVMEKAFQNGTLYKYIAPCDKVRAEFLRKILRIRLLNSLSHDEIHLAKEDGKIIGAAIWILSEVAGDNNNSGSKNSDLILNELSPDAKDRWIGFMKVLFTARSKSMKTDYWSLAPIVVLPEKQGMGIGSKLIRKQLTKIDSEGLPCFLATQDIDNLDIYYRYGFKVTSEDKIADSGIISYTMVRPGKYHNGDIK